MRWGLAAALAVWTAPAFAQTAPIAPPAFPPPSPPVTAPGDGMLDKPCPDPKGLWFGHPYVQANDWAWECKYAEADKQLAARPRVVFIGDSITEGWVPLAPALFAGGAVGRGISGQTSPQILVRFYQDVVRLRPRVVHIMIGTNDLAGNTGPNSPEMYKNHLLAMVDIARANGMRHVYVGNVHDAAASSTYCHVCGERLIGRDWYVLSDWGLTRDGHCFACGTRCPGVFDGPPGTWGAKRRGVRLADYGPLV